MILFNKGQHDPLWFPNFADYLSMQGQKSGEGIEMRICYAFSFHCFYLYYALKRYVDNSWRVPKWYIKSYS